MKDRKDRKVIEAFVGYLGAHGYTGLKVDEWPEDSKQNDIDAIAGPFAIEHTSVDTISKQRECSDWFMKAIGNLESELRDIAYRLKISIEYGAIRKGRKWDDIKKAIKEWIVIVSPQLGDGNHVIENATNIPFRLYIYKQSNRPAGIFIGRFAPSDNTFSLRIRELFDQKIDKLSRYHGANKTTLLLIENEDIALMNEPKMFDGINKAYLAGFPQSVDKVWYADTSIVDNLEFYDFTGQMRRK